MEKVVFCMAFDLFRFVPSLTSRSLGHEVMLFSFLIIKFWNFKLNYGKNGVAVELLF